MKSNARSDADRLLGDVAWALDRGLPARDLIAMLKKLVQRTEPGSPEWTFGMEELAFQLARHKPWQGALVARQLLDVTETERAWGALGLACTLLGHYRAAARAYRRALLLSPHCPECCHNLGHLLDMGFDRPRDGLRYLERAHLALPDEPEIAASYAHALLRAGQREAAHDVLSPLFGDRADELLADWAARRER